MSGNATTLTGERAARHRNNDIVAFAAAFVVLSIVLVLSIALTPTVRQPIPAPQIVAESGKAYLAKIDYSSEVFELPADGIAAQRSVARIFEDGRELGPPHSLHNDIRQMGAGRFSHWNDTLYFSSSDGSDPRSNGRSYTFVSSTQTLPWIPGLIAILDAVALVLLRRSVVRHFASDKSSVAHRARSRRAIAPYQVGIATVAVLAVAVACALASGLEYRTNDDVAMRLIAEAVFAAPGQSHFLFYQNIIHGRLLQALYALLPGWPWYDVSIGGGALFGGALCTAGMLICCRSRLEMAASAAIALVTLTPLFQALQFSATAMLLAAGAAVTFCLLFFGFIRGPVWRGVAMTAASVALIWGALIRFEAVFLVLFTVGPGIVLFGWRHFSRANVPLLAVGGFAVAVAFANLTYSAYSYSRSPGWETFLQENLARTRATDWLQADPARPDDFRTALDAVGWTPNDYDLLSGWLFSNKAVFSHERIEKFASLVPRKPIAERIMALGELFETMPVKFWIILILQAFLAFVAFGRWAVVSVFAGSVLLATVVTAIVFKAAFSHILLALYASAMLVSTVVVLAGSRDVVVTNRYLWRERVVLSACALSCLVALAIWQLRDVISDGHATEQLRSDPIAHDLGAWPLKQDDVLIIWDHNLPLEAWVRPFQAFHPPKWRMLHTTPITTSPLADSIYRSWGTSDIGWAMCHVPGVYRVEDRRWGYTDAHNRALTTLMKEHYGEKVRQVEVFSGQLLSLWVCKPDGSP